jgi:serine/threonine protein kinase
MTIPAGTVFGRYEIRTKIGSGGMGEVYTAEDRVLLRLVAIKFIKRQAHDPAGAEKRFMREARMASQLNHPNIVTIHEICETDELTYIVMEYVEGRNLRSLIMSRALSTEAALDTACQIADALAEAHARGVLHRDIKPENILVNERGQAKLLDFGLARAFEQTGSLPGEATMAVTRVENLTDSGVVVGTVPYMSPEQIRKEEPLDSRTDIFSFGIVLYEMLTGRHPFQGGNIFEIGASILSTEAVRTDALEATLPTGASGLLAGLLAKERARRIASFAEVRNELAALKLQLSRRGDADSNYAATLQLNHSLGARKARESQVPTASRSWLSWSRSTGVPPTVLVLPLEGVGDSQESSYIGVGLASVITTDLAKINNLSVLSKSAGAGRVNQTGMGARELASELGATILLEGEVMRAGQSVRITARLIDVASGHAIWGEQYRGDESDLFNIQDRVCASVAAALKLNVSEEVREQMAQPATTNIDAFELYSKGRDCLDRHDVEENLDCAIEMFDEALKLEPKFALAFAGLAEAYWRKYQYTHVNEWVPRAIAAGDRALVLDPAQAQVRISLGMVYHGTGKAERAIEEFEQAIELQPMSDAAYAWLGRCYMQKGDTEQALG